MKTFFCCLVLTLVCVPVSAVTLPGIPEFIDEMVEKNHFDRAELTRCFEQVNHRPLIIEAISRPATIKPWIEYRAAFVNRQRVKLGLAFWDRHRVALARAEKKFGVPQEIIVSLIGIETIYGKNSGNFRAIDALTTLAFDYPRRSAFFRDELENYLLLAREQHFDLFGIRSSYAGALGIPQFMPSSYRRYAVDFNGNHKTDLLNEPADAIGSVGHYLKEYGWVKGGPVAVRARIDGEIPASNAARSLSEWRDAGVSADTVSDAQSRLLDYTVADGDEKLLMTPLAIRLSEPTTPAKSLVMSGHPKEYWLGYNNFDVIRRYNNSDFYAMTVFQLAEALKAAH